MVERMGDLWVDCSVESWDMKKAVGKVLRWVDYLADSSESWLVDE